VTREGEDKGCECPSKEEITSLSYVAGGER